MRHRRGPRVVAGRVVVTVVPVTHSPPVAPTDVAVEIPAALKSPLGLDGQRSWIVVTEVNDFLWPGPDVRPVADVAVGCAAYGMLPPRFFAHVRDKILETNRLRRVRVVIRSE